MSDAEQARALVSYAKFPVPKDKLGPGVISGVRGAGSPFAPAVFGQSMPEYIATANKNTFVAVQIETVEGLSNCEEIAKVEGIGGARRLVPVLGSISYSSQQTCFSLGRLRLDTCQERSLSLFRPNDLCASMGYNAMDHANIPEVQEAIQRILNAAKAAGKYAGMFCMTADQAQARFKQGCTDFALNWCFA
jgi:4-hydroxy-2-oxoheptanedioate aldolase